MKDLYVDAVIEGITEYRRQTENRDILTEFDMAHIGPDGPGYWIARHAARQTCDALLQMAKGIGVTGEQWEALRRVAAEVAYD